MATIGYKLTATPQQVLDGTKAGYIEYFKGNKNARYVVSKTAPTITPTTYYHVLISVDGSFPKGFPVWAWSTEQGVELVVSTEEA